MKRIFTILAFFFIFFTPTVLWSATCAWTGAVSNDWNTAGNWSCGNVPTNLDDVVITSSVVGVTLVINAPETTVKSLTLTNVELKIEETGTFEVLQDATIQNSTISGLGDGGEFWCEGNFHISGNSFLRTVGLRVNNLFVDSGTFIDYPKYAFSPSTNQFQVYFGWIEFNNMIIASGATFETTYNEFSTHTLGRVAVLTNNGTLNVRKLSNIQRFLYNATVTVVNNGLLDVLYKIRNGSDEINGFLVNNTLENTSTGEIRIYSSSVEIEPSICGSGQINIVSGDSHNVLKICNNAIPNINISANAQLTCIVQNLGGNINIATGGILRLQNAHINNVYTEGQLNGTITGAGKLEIWTAAIFDLFGTLNMTGELYLPGAQFRVKSTASFDCSVVKQCSGILSFSGTRTLNASTSIINLGPDGTGCTAKLSFESGSITTINSVLPDGLDVNLNGETIFNQSGTLRVRNLGIGGKVTGITEFKVTDKFTASSSTIEIPSITLEPQDGYYTIRGFYGNNLISNFINKTDKGSSLIIYGNLTIASGKSFTNLTKALVNSTDVTINGNFINATDAVFEVGSTIVNNVYEVRIGDISFSANSVVTNNGTFINHINNNIRFLCPFTNNGLIKGDQSTYNFSGGFTNGLGGVISPGIATSLEDIGTLTFNGPINFGTGKLQIDFEFDIRPQWANPWGSDKLIVIGTSTLSGILEIKGRGSLEKLPANTEIITSNNGQLGNFSSFIKPRSIQVNANQFIAKTRISFSPVFSNWTGAISSDWNNVGNWSSNFVPDLYEVVRIASLPFPPTPPVNYTNTNGKAWRLEITGNTLNMSAGSKLTVQEALLISGGTINSEGTIALTSTSPTTFSNCTLSGTIALAGNASFVSSIGLPGSTGFVNLGISGSRTMRFTNINNNSPTFTITSGTTLRVNGTTYVDIGTINNLGTVVCNADFDYNNGQHQDYMTYNNTGKTVLNSGYFLSYPDRFYNPPGGIIELHGSNIRTPFCNQGAINVLENNSSVRLTAACTGFIPPGMSISTASGTIANGAALYADDSYINFPITINSGGQLTMTTSSVVGNGSINGNGMVRLFDHNYLRNGTTISSNLEFLVFDDYPIIYLPNGYTLGTTGKFRGKGTYHGGLSTVTVAGLVASGFSPGTLTINPSVTSTSTAVYEMEIIGGYGVAGIADDADKVESDNNIDLNGTVKIIMTNPAIGDYPIFKSNYGNLTVNGQSNLSTLKVLYSLNGSPFVGYQYPSANISIEKTNNSLIVHIKGLVVLPVELVSFKAKNTEGGNLLTWETANEVNTSHFDIERSNDGIKFEKIGESKAQNKAATYQFIDSQTSARFQTSPTLTTYYRLTINDLDGKTTTSKIISIEKNSENSIKIHRDTEGSVLIETDNTIELITMTNSIGQTVKATKDNRFLINDLASGIYIISVKTDKGFVSQKIFKQ